MLTLEFLHLVLIGRRRCFVRLSHAIALQFEASVRIIQRLLLLLVCPLGQSQPLALQRDSML